MPYEDILGLVAGVLTSIAMLPQLIKVIRERDAGNLSVWTLVVLVTGLSLWVCYGFLKKEWPIILSNSFAVLLNLSLLASCYIFRKKNQ